MRPYPLRPSNPWKWGFAAREEKINEKKGKRFGGVGRRVGGNEKEQARCPSKNDCGWDCSFFFAERIFFPVGKKKNYSALQELTVCQ